MILLKKVLSEVLDHNLLEVDGTPIYNIYCDMDGVFVDFDSGFQSISGGKPPSYFDQIGKSELIWRLIERQPNKGIDWWANLPKTKYGPSLWKYLTTTYGEVKILSSTGSRKSKNSSAEVGKRMWLRTNLTPTPDDKNIFLVDSAEAKQKYAKNEKDVLIDDLPINIQQWRNAGGTGILHVSTENTINQLKRLHMTKESYGYSWSNV